MRLKDELIQVDAAVKQGVYADAGVLNNWDMAFFLSSAENCRYACACQDCFLSFSFLEKFPSKTVSLRINHTRNFLLVFFQQK